MKFVSKVVAGQEKTYHVKATNSDYEKVYDKVSTLLDTLDIPAGWVGGQWGNGKTDDTSVIHERGAFQVSGKRAQDVAGKIKSLLEKILKKTVVVKVV